jgi:hypothetical protein
MSASGKHAHQYASPGLSTVHPHVHAAYATVFGFAYITYEINSSFLNNGDVGALLNHL